MKGTSFLGPTWPKWHLSFVWGLKNRPQGFGICSHSPCPSGIINPNVWLIYTHLHTLSLPLFLSLCYSLTFMSLHITLTWMSFFLLSSWLSFMPMLIHMNNFSLWMSILLSIKQQLWDSLLVLPDFRDEFLKLIRDKKNFKSKSRRD